MLSDDGLVQMRAKLELEQALAPASTLHVDRVALCDVLVELLQVRKDLAAARAAIKENFEDTGCCPMCSTHDKHYWNCLLHEEVTCGD